MKNLLIINLLLLFTYLGTAHEGIAQTAEINDRVKKYLEDHRSSWKDLNVPYEDGQIKI